MQYPFSFRPETYSAIEFALSPERLRRYLPFANGDMHMALRLYVWNAHICEALYLPMQFAEVATRNAVKIPVQKRFGERWFENAKFINILPNRMKDQLNEVVQKEGHRRRAALNQSHVIARLSFGFWVSLMTSAYDKQLWMHGVEMSFPAAKKNDDRRAIHRRLERLRTFRNNVAHHVAIFDRQPQAEFQNALYITGLICADTHWLSSELAQVSRVINARPRA